MLKIDRVQAQKLPGGLHVLTIPEPRLPVARLTLALPLGGYHDPLGKSGLTALRVDMLMRGTKRRSRAQFNEALERTGSRVDCVVGGDVAFVRATCLARYLEPVIALLCEALSEPAFESEQFVQLVSESLEHLRVIRDDDDDLADLFLREALYAAHPARRLPQGDFGDIAAMDLRDVVAAHQTPMPSDLLVAWAGDVEPSETLLHAQKIADALARAKQAEKPRLPPFDDLKTPTILIVDKPERGQAQLRIACHGLAGTHPQSEALWLGVMAFGGTFTSPFCQQIRDERGWSYVAQADFHHRSSVAAPLVLRSAPSASDLLSCVQLELELFERFQTHGPDDASIDMARAYLLNRFPFSVATASDLMGPVVQAQLIGHDAATVLQQPQRLAQMTCDEVRGAVQNHVRADAPAIVVVGDGATFEKQLTRAFPNASVRVVDYRHGIPE